MAIGVLPTNANLLLAIKNFLSQEVLPSGVSVIKGENNRAAMPKGDFVVVTPLDRVRLSTNVDTYADLVFTASIAGNVMDVTDMDPRFTPPARISLGSVLFGVGVPANTFVSGTGTSGTTGGTGTYLLSQALTFLPGTLAAGTETMLQPVRVVVQLDVYGPSSADYAHMISTMWRDERAATAFKSYGFDIQPLYADDPKFLTFVNAEMQYEDRWTIQAFLQANEAVINVPQQFADQVIVGLIDVDVFYPA